jgi:hypothetical protein
MLPCLIISISLTIFTFASEKLGWSKIKTDEILLPVLKRLNFKEVQLTPVTYWEGRGGGVTPL